MKLGNTVAIVTGGGSGIGRAIALRFAGEGAKLVVLDINEESATDTAKTISKEGGIASSLKTDVSKQDQVKRAVEFAIEQYGSVNILVNNAGIPSFHSLVDTSEEEWDRVTGVNLKGAFLMMKDVIPRMVVRKDGTILNIGSTTGLVGKENRCAYGVSKAGLIFLTKSAALEYARFHIRANCICLGTIDTPLTRRAAEMASNQSDIVVSLGKDHPIGRLGTTDEIASLALFLCSRDCEFLTGAIIPIDGGKTAGNYSGA